MILSGTVHGRHYICGKCESEWIVLTHTSGQCPTCGSKDISEMVRVFYRCKKCENEWSGKPAKKCPSCKTKEIEEVEVKDSRVCLGSVGVDSGQLVICDPCYIKHDKTQKELNDYDQLLSIRRKVKGESLFDYRDRRWSQLKYDGGDNGLGVVFDSGCGDGTYQVFATVGEVPGWGRKVKKVEVVLIEEPEAGDYEFNDECDEEYIKFQKERERIWEERRKKEEEI